jgi:predicted DsbA family dithiol-disulfide isomerase
MSLAVLAAACGGPQRPALPPGACRPAEAEQDPPPWETRGYAMPVPWFAPKRGAERPRVVIQAFSDFECPYCARAAPTLERVLEDYGDCVQVVWRNRPLRYHEHAEPAALAAIEVYEQAGDEAFWRYHDRLFADQSALSRADLEAHAEAVGGVDMDAFRAALDEAEHQGVIERDRRAGERTGIEPLGTPAFFVNGELIHGARRYERFRRAVEDALRDQLTTTSMQVNLRSGGSGTVFGALLRLTGPSDGPDAPDLTGSDVLGTTLVTVLGGASSTTVSAPITAVLSPGWYAAIFGTGAFGATLSTATIHSNSGGGGCGSGYGFPITIRQSDGMLILQGATPHFQVDGVRP